MNRPIVFSAAPQVHSTKQEPIPVSNIAEYVLWHGRNIVNRIDDSIVRIIHHEPRILKRARAYAPIPMALPKGFDQATELLAMGCDSANTFCLIKDGKAILSPQLNDLNKTENFHDYQHNLALYAQLYDHKPEQIVIDYQSHSLSSQLGKRLAQDQQIKLQAVPHHHAHIAACLAENHYPLDAEPVLGVALDSLGLGTDNRYWGGEFLLCDYRHAQRIGTFKPVAILDDTLVKHEPWHDTYAHLMAEMGWAQLTTNYAELELVQYFASKPLAPLNTLLTHSNKAVLASSCDRLFAAVAAAIGICRETLCYQGQAVMELEALVDLETLHHEDDSLAYPFAIPQLNTKDSEQRLPYIEPLAMWQALLGDLILQTPAAVIAARFHKGLAKIIVTMIQKLSKHQQQRLINTVALSGEVLHNKILFEQIVNRLQQDNFTVLTHHQIPSNDAGIALGQALIATASSLPTKRS